MDLNLFFLVLGSGLLHASWNYVAKTSSANMAVGWLAQFVAMFFLLSIAVVRYASGEADALAFDVGVLPYVAGSGALQASYFLLLTAAYRIGDVSVVYPIARGMGVAGTCVVGIFIYSDAPSVVGLLGCICVALGSASIGFASYKQSDIGRRSVELAVLVGICMSFGSFFDKRAAMLFDPPFYLGLVYASSILTSAPYYLRNSRRADIRKAVTLNQKAILVIGIGVSLTYLIILFALKHGPLGYIAAVREVSIIFGAATGVYFLNERITRAKVVGLLVITGGIALIRMG